MKPSARRTMVAVLAALALVAGAFLVLRQPTPRAEQKPVVRVSPVVANAPAGPAATPTAAASPTPTVRTNPDFQQRPLPVGYEDSKAQWALEDGKDTNVIRQLAHNALEYQRMVEENPRILRRQLVYLKETAAAVFEQARLSGQPVRQLTLPGVDGKELQFEIVESEGNGSSRHGMFSGHLAGNADSMVTLAFQDGREAFTVLSPQDKIFVAGEPREPGQVIVKALDPNSYGRGPQGGEDFIRTEPHSK